MKKFLSSVKAPVHNVDPPYGSLDSPIVNTSWHAGNAHAIHRYLTNPRNGYNDGYEDDHEGLMNSFHGGDALHKHVMKHPAPKKGA